MYKAMFAMAYYGLFRIGELASGEHTVKASDIHIGVNKEKILIFLYSSKMHQKGGKPQKVKISADKPEISVKVKQRHFCPFNLVVNFLRIRGNYRSVSDQFFMFNDGQPVAQRNVRLVLAQLISKLGLNPKIYSFHSMRAGRASDLYHWVFFN